VATTVLAEESKDTSDLDSVFCSVTTLETPKIPKEEALDGANCYRNIFKENRKTKDHHGVVICGHRGGFKATNTPENTILAFQKAIEMGLSTIELDIWLTKDDKLVIIHGGDSGEMPAPVEKESGYKPKYIFEMTFEEIQS